MIIGFMGWDHGISEIIVCASYRRQYSPKTGQLFTLTFTPKTNLESPVHLFP